MRGGATLPFGAIVVAGVMLAGCSGTVPAGPTSTTQTSPTASPAAADATLACPPSSGDGRSPTAEPGAWPGLSAPAGLSSAIEAESAELVAAIGNPDTGSPSPAWEEFEDALDSDDPAAIRQSAEAVLGHLRAACEPVAAFFDEPAAGAWVADVRGLLDGLAGVVTAIREAAIRQDQRGVDAGHGQMQTVLLDHFYQSFRMSDPEAWRVQLPSRGWSATASHVRWLAGEVGAAFDAKSDTMWLAGDVAPPQWIELDFGAELAVSGIRLLAYQDADGATDHRVTVRTATGRETELVRFSSETRDAQWLEFTSSTPLEQVRYLRVTTLASPSMIGWRELEVMLAPGSTAGPCPGSSTITTDIALTAAGPSTSASDPGLAVDGDESTGWDPGPDRGAGGTRGWIRVWFASQVRISEVRVLLGPASATAIYEVVLFPPGELGTRLGTLAPISAEGGWATLAGPDPCLPYESVYIGVRSEEPAAMIREIQVIGSPAEPPGNEPPARSLATSEVPLNGMSGTVDQVESVLTAGVRTSETNLGNLAVDAMLWQARQLATSVAVDSPQVALLNGGAIRIGTVIPPGPITAQNVSDILPFAADVVAVKEDIPADAFKALLETSVSEIGSPRFGQWSGVTFSYDPAAPKRVIDGETCAVATPGSRVRDVSVSDIRIFEDGEFVGPAGWTVDLAANDYTLRGGDCYPFGSGDFIPVGVNYRQALANYLITPTADGGLQGVIAAADYPPDGEGRITPLP